MEAKPLSGSDRCPQTLKQRIKSAREKRGNNRMSGGFKAMLASGVMALVMMFGASPVQAAEAEPVKTDVGERMTLVLDAGHGGNDPGAIDPVNGIYEADLAQHVLDRLYPMLQSHKDELQVILTHEAGENPSINKRASVAQDNDADLFVSLHLNAAERTSARGFSVYAPPPGYEHHDESVKAAHALIDRVKETGLPIMGDDGVYYCFYRGYEKLLYDSGSYAQMNRIELPTFGVLENSGTPALLVEQWFVTNPEDMEMFANSEGKDLMAQQLYRGLCDYFGIEAKY